MKKMMMMGGLLGFGLGAATGLVKEITWPALFLRACVTSFLAGLLFRWWGRVWLSGLRDTIAQAKNAAAATAAAAAKNPKSGPATK